MMEDLFNDLPPWLLPLAGILVALMVVSGVGILVLEWLDTPPVQQAAPITETTPAAPTPLPTATPLPPDYLPLGEVVAGSITPAQPTRSYILEANTGDLLGVELSPAPGSAAAYVTLELFNAAGTLVEYAPHTGNLSTQLMEGGRYRLDVTSNLPASFGDFNLRAYAATPGDVPPHQRFDETAWQTSEEGTLLPGESATATIVGGSVAHLWRVPVERGTLVRARIEGPAVLDTFGNYERHEYGYERYMAKPTADGVAEIAYVGDTDDVLRITPQGGMGGEVTYTLRVETVESFTEQRILYGTNITHNQPVEHLFYGRAGQQWAFYTPGDVRQTLTTAQGEEVALDFKRDLVEHQQRSAAIYTLPEDGTYTLTTQHEDDYYLSSAILPDGLIFERPDTLTLDTNVRTSILDGEMHTYTFEAKAGVTYAVDVEGTMQTHSNDVLQILITIEGPGLGDDISERGRVVFTATESGPYTIEIRGEAPPVQTYSLRVEETSPFEPRNLEGYTTIYSQELGVGERISGRIERADHAHEYTLTRDEAGTYTVQLINLREAAFCVEIIGQLPVTCPTGHEEVVVTRPDPGTIRILPSEGQTGSYTLNVIEGYPPFGYPAEATRLEPGNTYTGNTAGYLFEAAADQAFGFAIYPETNAYDYQIIVRDPTGFERPIGKAKGFYEFRADTAGTHILYVRSGYDDEIPAEGYTLRITDDPTPPTAERGPLNVGEYVATELTDHYTVDVWEVPVEAGQLYTLWVDVPSASETIALLRRDPDSLRAERFAVNGRRAVRFRAEEDATYLVEIYRQNVYGQHLAYSLRLTEGLGLNVTQTQTINPETDWAGGIRTPFEAQQWLVTAERDGQEITVEIEGHGFGVLVQTPSGELLRVNTAMAEETFLYRFIAEEAGLYVVTVLREDGDMGFYTLRYR